MVTKILNLPLFLLSIRFGIGNSNTFLVDGAEGVNLNLTIGNTYVFHNDAPCYFPFYISTSIDGPNGNITNAVTIGVSGAPQGTVCAGRELSFTPTASMYGTQFYYQSLFQQRVGGLITICNQAGECAVQPPTPTQVPTTSETSCLSISLLFVILLCSLFA